jgi:alpha-galactosidase
MAHGLSLWLPLTDVGAPNLDHYTCRSGLGAHFCLAANWLSTDARFWSQARQRVAESNSLKHLFQGDFYPLTRYSLANDAWIAWQFDRPDRGQGLVQAFRRSDSPLEKAAYRLQALEEKAQYLVKNLDEAGSWRTTGKELRERGLTIHLPGKPSAAIITYQKEPVPRG